MNHSQFKEKALKNKFAQDEYKALEPEFNLLREMLKARNNAGLNQAEAVGCNLEIKFVH